MTNAFEPGDAGPSATLCVDLDGTLLRSDSLYESFLLLIRQDFLAALRILVLALGSRARFKQALAVAIIPDPQELSLDERVLDVLRASGDTRRVLVTAADENVAAAFAQHVGLFDEVIASDGRTNLGGRDKARVLVERYGEKCFDYMGNTRADLHVWRHARRGWVVNAPPSLARQAADVTDVVAYWPVQRSASFAWVRALRMHQWLKNLLVFLPLLAAHRVLDVSAFMQSVLAFLAFGLCASSVYILNDLLDLQSDRQHPRKRRRPFASADIPILHGMLAAPALLGGAFIVAWLAGPLFALALAAYWLTTFAYSFWLKRIAMLDVTILAGLYTSRIIAGALAVDVPLSFWMLAFSMFLFFSLATLKRLVEIRAMTVTGIESLPGRAYLAADLGLLQALGVGSGVVAVLVLALYINSPESLELYRRPDMLWLLCPVLLYWISHIWLLANRGVVHDDPVVFAATDRVSLAVAAVGLSVLLLSV